MANRPPLLPTVDLAFGLFESEVVVLKGVLSLLFIFHLSGVLIFRSLLDESLNVFMKLQSPFYHSYPLATVFRVFHEVILPCTRS